MYARVTFSQINPGMEEENTHITKDSVIPSAKKQKGYIGLYQLADRKNKKGIVITLWESEADMIAAETNGFYQQQVAKFKDIVSGPTTREAYEVIIKP
jgi:heme-degrading monooxygenase HmoA